MKLYYSPGTCALLPHIVLKELGLTASLSKVDLASKKTDDGQNYFDVNPNGYVPALQLDNGKVLTEANIIAQYLADQKPGNTLLPAAGQFERYQQQEWLNFITSEVHKTMGAFFNPKLHPETRAALSERLGQRLNYIVSKLGSNDWLTGSHFTIADAYLFVVLNWCGWVKFDLTPWPALQAFQQRVAARAAVQAAMAEEGIGK
ncbi:glutathione transferase GstA [Permianibacter sp. IMCC34836]|uniref:glutathione transferase GstA n=1 Tax=Permianibacter fluminis TaxID=2738515 RepID=UPI001555179A|nr:glutathione transferase GstA [Permianibacter fluminis]NQD35531.1 glutathione transferase GstA [Permianibacter fluminis]